jgi:HD-GYP domain-containing protein (c-di-GMP phosphodiesterase class II)
VPNGRANSVATSGAGAGAPSPSLSLTDRTHGHCLRLLGDAVKAVDGHGGAIFAVAGRDELELVVADEANPERQRALELAARHGLRGQKASFVEDLWAPPSGDNARLTNLSLVVPVHVEDVIVAVLVVSGAGGGELSVEECVRRTGHLVFAMALTIDRLRMEKAIDQRGEDITALRLQLDAYALDFRSTYVAEKERAQQLVAALAELEETYRATVRGLAIAVEAKDEVTGGHIRRVCRYGMMLTALLAPDHADDPQFEYGFLLHDVGKLTVPDSVLTKPGALDDAEWALMKRHPESGRSILEDIPFLAGAREIVYAHHERWDGNGYPRGLAGEDIPLGAQIFPLCDAYDAMTSERPYRQASSAEHARAEVRMGRGTQFWPRAVDAFLSLPVDEVEAVRAGYRESSA